MFIKKYIDVCKSVAPIRVECSDRHAYFGDTTVTIYDEYKISFVLSDDCGAVIGDKVYFPKRGDVMIFRPNEIHFGRFPKMCKYNFISFFIPIDFFDEVFKKSKSIIAPFLDTSDDRINLIRLPDEYKNRFIDISEELLCVLRSDFEIYDVLIFAKLVEVLGFCEKFYCEQKSLSEQATVPFLITHTIQKIDESFPEFVGLNELARCCGCSVTYLTQTFKQYTGKSIHNYLTERRLESARRLLQNGASVTETCYQCGFSDCSGFISLFKKRFNITPGKYKKDKRPH